jgi:type IV pilus assembly protein PilP
LFDFAFLPPETPSGEPPLKSNNSRATRQPGIAVVAALAVSISACSYDSADLRDYVAEVKSRPGGKLDKHPVYPPPEPIPEISQRADPFESFLKDELENTAKPIPPKDLPWPPRNEEELERYALDSLRMVGTLEQKEEQWGLVRDPGGVIHRVKAGNFMGKNYGKIIEVSEHRMHLLEKIPDGLGSWEDREAKISLSE